MEIWQVIGKCWTLSDQYLKHTEQKHTHRPLSTNLQLEFQMKIFVGTTQKNTGNRKRFVLCEEFIDKYN